MKMRFSVKKLASFFSEKNKPKSRLVIFEKIFKPKKFAKFTINFYFELAKLNKYYS